MPRRFAASVLIVATLGTQVGLPSRAHAATEPTVVQQAAPYVILGALIIGLAALGRTEVGKEYRMNSACEYWKGSWRTKGDCEQDWRNRNP